MVDKLTRQVSYPRTTQLSPARHCSRGDIHSRSPGTRYVRAPHSRRRRSRPSRRRSEAKAGNTNFVYLWTMGARLLHHRLSSRRWATFLGRVRKADFSDVVHYLIDLYTALISSHADISHQPSPVSPKEPIPNPAKASASMPTSAYTLSAYWTPQTLTELKIHLRDRRPGKPAVVAWVNTPDDDDSVPQHASEGMGRNDGTIRFVWESVGA